MTKNDTVHHMRLHIIASINYLYADILYYLTFLKPH